MPVIMASMQSFLASLILLSNCGFNVAKVISVSLHQPDIKKCFVAILLSVTARNSDINLTKNEFLIVHFSSIYVVF